MSPTPAPAEAGLRPAPQGNPKPKSARSYRVEEWFRLPTATVEVRQHGTYVRTAMVDAATPDSRMLWLSPEGVDSRVLIDKRDGYEVWIDPQQLYYTRQHR